MYCLYASHIQVNKIIHIKYVMYSEGNTTFSNIGSHFSALHKRNPGELLADALLDY